MPPGKICPGQLDESGSICELSNNVARTWDHDDNLKLRRVLGIEEPREILSLKEKVVNFASAVVHHVAAGFPRLSDEETELRLDICHGCPQFHDRTCVLCGCNMRIKASWAEQKCPLGKWPGEENFHEMVEESSGCHQESR